MCECVCVMVKWLNLQLRQEQGFYRGEQCLVERRNSVWLRRSSICGGLVRECVEIVPSSVPVGGEGTPLSSAATGPVHRAGHVLHVYYHPVCSLTVIAAPLIDCMPTSQPV